ncbi:MAG: hypothetical protein ACW97P_03130, partial [Candidatus Hodarchaeales archaeon]
GKINETVTLMRDFLPRFVENIPMGSLELFKLYFHALIKSPGTESQLIEDNIISLNKIVYNSLLADNKDLFSQQVALFIQGLSEMSGAQEWLLFFLEEVINHLIEKKYYIELLFLIRDNLVSLEITEASTKYSLIRKIAPLFNNKNIPEDVTLSFISFIFKIAKTLDDSQKGIVASILSSIGNSNKRRKKIKNFAHEQALALSQEREDSEITFNLLVSQFRNEFEAEEYHNSLEIIDNVIPFIENRETKEESRRFAEQMRDQIEPILQILTQQRKKRWLDLFTNKNQQIINRFLKKLE